MTGDLLRVAAVSFVTPVGNFAGYESSLLRSPASISIE